VGGRLGFLVVVAVAAALAAAPAASAQGFACQNRNFVFDSLANSRAVTSELFYTGSLNGMMRARAIAHDVWERFRMVCLDGGQFAIRALNNNRYVSAELGYAGNDNGVLRARATVIGPWERFTFEQASQRGEFFQGSFKSVANGRYVAAEQGYPVDDVRYGMLRARATVKDAWEQFELSWLPADPQPSAPDADADGFPVGQDCNDGSAAIKPGAVEVAGNGIDENCDGIDEELPPITSGVSSEWLVVGKRLTIRKLRVRAVPAGATVEFRCKGKRCAAKRVRVSRPRGGSVNLLSKLGKRRRYRAGQTLEVRITALGWVGKVVRYRLKRGSAPDGQPLCLRPGEAEPERC
jgi:hypothetical protein